MTYLINGMEQLATANSGLLDSQCVFTSVISANLSIIYPSVLQPLRRVILSEIGQWMIDARKELLLFGLVQTTLYLDFHYLCTLYFAMSNFLLGYGSHQ